MNLQQNIAQNPLEYENNGNQPNPSPFSFCQCQMRSCDLSHVNRFILKTLGFLFMYVINITQIHNKVSFLSQESTIQPVTL